MFPSLEAAIPDSFSAYLLNAGAQAYRLAYHRILLVTGGMGTLLVDDNQFQIEGPSLFLLSKGQVYAEGEVLQMTGYGIAFGDCFWDRAPSSAHNCKAVLFNNAADNQCLRLSDEDMSQLTPHIRALHQEAAAGPYINKLDVLAAFLKIIMIKIANINAALTKVYDNYERQLYHRFIQLVSQQYGHMHEVAGYARQLHVTARRLSDVCKRISGKGAKQVINGQLLAEAKRQLQFSALAVKEIAYQLNFATPEQFSQFFKKNTQQAPSDYRSFAVNIDR